MRLFATYLGSEVKALHEDNVRLRFIGERSRLKPGLQKKMAQAEQLTAVNSGPTLVIAVDYGGQWDIANAARRLAERAARGELDPALIDADMFDGATALADLPKPDLLIRTAGEQRISNFMLWQLAYSELYYTDTYWPDFGELEMLRALQAFAQRERRYGGRELPLLAAAAEGSGSA
jgi:undecaprenyl diphosphate synthase